MPASKQPLHDYPARRIALIKPSALGDIVHSLPVLSALRRRYPDAHITWVVNRGFEPLLKGHPQLDATLPFDRGLLRKSPLRGAVAAARFLGELRRQRFDLAIDLQGLLRSGLMTAATGAARRVGFATAREGSTWFYTDHIAGADFNTVHAVDRYWLVAEAFGVGHLGKTFHVHVPDDARLWAGEALADCPRPWLMAGPGSRWETKRWPPAHFAELLRRSQARFGGTAVFVGVGDDTPLSRAVSSLLDGPVRDFTGKTELPQLAALLARADVMLANDTGPLHLAAALGRPVIAPYTCTKVKLTGPYGPLARAEETRVWCKGSYIQKCPRLECMAELTPDRLWPHVEEVLSRWQTTRHSA
jgi:lipopolysaccharide heptosyltransferase I